MTTSISQAVPTLNIDQLLFDRLAPTPKEWLGQACHYIEPLLNDHAACEKKAAQFALGIAQSFPNHPDIQQEAVLIAREELRHYQQVLQQMQAHQLKYAVISPSTYAQQLRALSHSEPVLHKLLVASLIEARSCERFLALVPVLKPQYPALSVFYNKLYLAEKRHALIYIQWALTAYTLPHINAQLTDLCEAESRIITSRDKHFRFHSGPV